MHKNTKNQIINVTCASLLIGSIGFGTWKMVKNIKLPEYSAPAPYITTFKPDLSVPNPSAVIPSEPVTIIHLLNRKRQILCGAKIDNPLNGAVGNPKFATCPFCRELAKN